MAKKVYKVAQGTYWIETAFWQGTFFVGFCPSAKAWAATMKHMKMDEPYPVAGGSARCTTFDSGSGKIVNIITIGPNTDEAESPIGIMALVAHEVWHAVEKLREHMHIEHEPTTEYETHILQVWSMHIGVAYRDSRKVKALGWTE